MHTKTSLNMFDAGRFFCMIVFLYCSVFSTRKGIGQSSFRTIAFTGSINDFNGAEQFVAASGNTSYAIAFDQTYIYFGAFRTTGVFASDHAFTFYIDTDPRNTLNSGQGTTQGLNYNNFTPTLPFNADFSSHTTDLYPAYDLKKWNGLYWESTLVATTTYNSSTSREVRIPLAQLGMPSSLYVTMWIGYDGGIYSNAPGTANEGVGATRIINGFFGSFPVYKTGINPVSFRTQNTTNPDGGGTAIPNLNLSSNGDINGDFGDIVIDLAATGTVTGTSSFSGSLTLSGTSSNLNLGTHQLNVGGRTFGSTGQIVINNTASIPINGTSTSGSVNFLGKGLISGSNPTRTFGANSTISISSRVDFGGCRLNGILLINSNSGIVSDPPIYGFGSTLIYNSGGICEAYNEWRTSGTFGISPGLPFNVIIRNGTIVTFGGSNAPRQVSGNMSIESGSGLTLSSNAGGDLFLAGDFTQNGILTPNNRSIFLVGTNNQLLRGHFNSTEPYSTNWIPRLYIAKTEGVVTVGANIRAGLLDIAGAALTFGGNFSITATTITNNGTINMVDGSMMNINSLIINNSALNMVANSSVNMGNNSSWSGNGTIGALGIINFTNGNISSTSTFPNVRISSGSVNFKGCTCAGYATIGTSLEMQAASLINTNPPLYAPGSTLIYNVSGTYERGLEWGQITPGAQGFPYHVLVDPSTALLLDYGYPTNIEISGNLTILGQVSMGALKIPLKVGGNLIIGDNSINTGSSLTLSTKPNGDLWLNGDFIRYNDNLLAYGDRAVYLKGTANAKISTFPITAGNPTQFFRELIIDKNSTCTITLKCPVGIEAAMTFYNGLVVSDYSNILVINDNAIVTGANANSFVNGPVRKIGNQAFTFPVGSVVGGVNHFRSISIAAPGSPFDIYEAEFIRGNAQTMGNVQSPIVRVSQCEYWMLSSLNGESNLNNVTLTWSSQSPCNTGNYVTDLNELTVARLVSNTWINQGRTSSSLSNPPITDSGQIASGFISGVNNPSFFTLASTSIAENSLPFQLLSFKAKINATKVQLDWSVGGNDEQKEYLVEHSIDGIKFKVIWVVVAKAALVQADYTIIHPNPVDGLNYYRITAVAFNNNRNQSHIARLYICKAVKISLSPNPVISSLNLFIAEPGKINNVALYSLTGEFLQEFHGVQTQYMIDMTRFARGQYLLRIRLNQGDLTIPFVKQE
ncbi:MAG: hypothetical protein KGP35_08485 [Bacteroidetes bacterium]|nr:hypothetical protein [Bacteroidota bacterium]